MDRSQLGTSPQPSGRACDFRGAALRPGGSCGLLRFLDGTANSKFIIQNEMILLGMRRRAFQFGLQPAEVRQVRQRTAGLRRPQAAARTVLTDRNNIADDGRKAIE